MKRFIILSLTIAVLAMAVTSCATSGLPTFGAEIGRQSNPVPGMDDIRAPYQDMISYFGYIKPGAAPDAEVNGKKMYYLYVWIPLVAPEIGARMVSPVPEGMAPAKGDYVAPNFGEAAKDKASYFDTWITIERSATAINPADIKAAATGKWITYASNDDSSELPAQPSGSKYNSVVRQVSEVSDPLKALVRGVYRIGFTTYKVGEVKGSFLAQVGAPIKLPGVVIAANLEALAAAVK